MTIRRALPADRDTLGRLGAMLMRTHYDFDRLRFLRPGEDADQHYGEFLVSLLEEDDAVVFVAEGDGRVDGYVYAAIEPLSWQALRDRAGFIHDVAVDPAARRHGVASALITAALDWVRERGLPRVMLGASPSNTAARAAFARFGFRDTMIEMTLEL
jgi:ribosomal protein S18 acetylase RimI-like enzyme